MHQLRMTAMERQMQVFNQLMVILGQALEVFLQVAEADDLVLPLTKRSSSAFSASR